MMIPPALAGTLLQSWTDVKLGLEQSIPFGSGWLHLLVGPLIFFGAALVMRKGLTSWAPWLAVCLLEALNEIIDLAVVPGPSRASQFGQSAIDFLLTILIPSLLLMIARSGAFDAESISATEKLP